MIAILADHNLIGQADLLWSTLTREGWVDLIPLRLVHFAQIGLPIDSSDRIVWRFAQAEQMLLLTANRNMDGEDSLELTLQLENHPSSLPVLTIGRIDRMVEAGYRLDCATRLAEIALFIHNYLGTGRLWIP